MGDFEIAAGAGTLYGSAAGAVSFPRQRTAEGVLAEALRAGATVERDHS